MNWESDLESDGEQERERKREGRGGKRESWGKKERGGTEGEGRGSEIYLFRKEIVSRCTLSSAEVQLPAKAERASLHHINQHRGISL